MVLNLFSIFSCLSCKLVTFNYKSIWNYEFHQNEITFSGVKMMFLLSVNALFLKRNQGGITIW